ncbi:hypothetical protein C8Q76DRAFT_789856 [Earliella scabrosa]|nr:hypothetical protein C8Q76DRAFT_789856 [Earliella scabrosa]
MTSTAWANPYQLHPWFRMPSNKRKDLSDDDEESPSPFYDSRRSVSPIPSPKRRRCDVLENGMSQLTLDGRSIASSAPYILASVAPVTISPSPTIQYPDAPATSPPTQLQWTDASYAPRVTQIPPNAGATVVLPGSVEEPTSPETVSEDAEVRDVSMKGPSWYEIEKDRTSASLPPPLFPSSAFTFTPAPSTSTSTSHPPSHGLSVHSTRRPLFRHPLRPPRPTVADARSDDDTGIVITDLEDSDAEDDENTPPRAESAGSPDGEPAFTISSALLDRLPKPHALGPLTPEPGPSNALVLYRPLVPLGESSEDTDSLEKRMPEKENQGDEGLEEEQPMGEEVPMEDTRPCTPMVLESVDEPVYEPMDIEML